MATWIFIALISSLSLADSSLRNNPINPPLGKECLRRSRLTSFALAPNCFGVDLLPDGRRYVFKTNYMGLRDREYAPTPAPDTFRILLFAASQGVDTEGISIATELQRHLAEKISKLKCRYRKVEVINASSDGGDILRTFLSLPRLLGAYSPHVVYVTDTLQSHGMQQLFEYRNALDYDKNRGVVVAMGLVHHYWPLPFMISEWIKKRLPRDTSELVIALRMAFTQIGVSIGLIRGESGRSPYLDVHLRHLDAINEMVGKERLYVFNFFSNKWDPHQIFENHKRARVANNKAEHIGSKLLPWHYLRKADLVELEIWSQAHYNYIDISDRLIHGEAMELLYKKNDVHFSIEGIKKVAAVFADSVSGHLLQSCLKK